MALVDANALVYVPEYMDNALVSTTFLIDAANEWVGAIFQATRTGTVTKIAFRTGTVSATYGTIRIGLQQLDETTGPPALPTGTPPVTWLSSSYADQATLASNTNYVVTLSGGGASVTAGSYYALVIKWANDGDFAAGWSVGFASVNTKFVFNFAGTGTGTSVPSGTTYGYSGAAATAQAIMFDLIYSGDVLYPLRISPVFSADNTVVNIDSDGVIRAAGVRFKVPFSARLAGVSWYGDNDLDMTVELLSDSGATQHAAITKQEDIRVNTSASSNSLLFPTPFTLTIDTWYRLVFTATSTTQAAAVFKLTYRAAESLGQLALGMNFYYTQRTGDLSSPPVAADWDDTATSSRPVMALIFDQLDAGGAAGSGGTYGY